MKRQQRMNEIRSEIKLLEAELDEVMKGCQRKLAPGRYFNYCGETDMGQTPPAFCTECGGDYELKRS